MTTIHLAHIDANRIASVCDLLDMSFRPSYSGRGMYGASCIGVVHREATAVAELCQELRDSGDDVLAKVLARGGRQDNMGLRTITYWPNIVMAAGYIDPEDDENEDDES